MDGGAILHLFLSRALNSLVKCNPAIYLIVLALYKCDFTLIYGLILILHLILIYTVITVANHMYVY